MSCITPHHDKVQVCTECKQTDGQMQMDNRYSLKPNTTDYYTLPSNISHHHTELHNTTNYCQIHELANTTCNDGELLNY